MTEWKECVLGDVIELVGGGTPKTTNPEYWDGDIPWLSVVDFNTGNKYVYKTEKTITQKGLDNSSTKILNENDIIISARGTVGAIAVLKKTMAFNQSCYGIKSIKDVSEQNFLYYLTKDSINSFKQIAHGGVFDTITKGTFNAIDILLPPLPEQRAIASVLSSLDDKIDLLHRQNKTLEAMAETLFRQWFVEEADEGWGKVFLNDVISVKGGTTPSTKNPEYWDGDIYWTSPRDLSNHISVFIFDTNKKITERGLEKIGSGLLPIGTVLLSSRAPIGYLAITEIPLAINQGYIAIVCDKMVSNYFIYLWCKANMDGIKNQGNGSVFQEIAKSVFKDIGITIPPSSLLDDFDKEVNPIFSKIKTNQSQIRTLEKLRDTLLPKLMSGEVRVKLEQ